MSTPAPFGPFPTPNAHPLGWTCSKCRFGAHMSDGSLQCRYVSPGVFTAITAVTWATIQPTDWCGDYVPAP